MQHCLWNLDPWILRTGAPQISGSGGSGIMQPPPEGPWCLGATADVPSLDALTLHPGTMWSGRRLDDKLSCACVTARVRRMMGEVGWEGRGL